MIFLEAWMRVSIAEKESQRSAKRPKQSLHVFPECEPQSASPGISAISAYLRFRNSILAVTTRCFLTPDLRIGGAMPGMFKPDAVTKSARSLKAMRLLEFINVKKDPAGQGSALKLIISSQPP